MRDMTAAYVAEHGSLPLCACGCGNPTKLDRDGNPRQFTTGHNQRAVDLAERSARRRRSHEMVRVDYPVFRAMLRDYKQKNGLTWPQVAERGGISHSHLQSIMFSNFELAKGVTKQWAQQFLDRLAGKSLPPTSYQRRQMVAMNASESYKNGKLYAVMIVKNEADRYLQSCLEWNGSILDGLLIVDDGSRDDTYNICISYTDNVFRRPAEVPSFMEDESRLREFAWERLAQVFEPGDTDWVLSIDADEFVVCDGDRREALDLARIKALKSGWDCVQFPIPEMWSMESRRVDGFWGDLSNVRMVQWQGLRSFPRQKMGGGSVPRNYPKKNSYFAKDIAILHYGYADQSDRIEKSIRYASVQDHGHSSKHIASIVQKATLELWNGSFPEVWRGMA